MAAAAGQVVMAWRPLNRNAGACCHPAAGASQMREDARAPARENGWAVHALVARPVLQLVEAFDVVEGIGGRLVMPAGAGGGRHVEVR